MTDKQDSISHKITQISQRLFEPTARVGLFIIFFLFGFLKLIGISPADDLAQGFTTHMGFGDYFNVLFIVLAIIECAVGLLFLFPRLTTVASLAMIAHLLFVSSPIILYTAGTWQSLFVPNLAGQYIIKNIALIALGMGLISIQANKKST